jgi:hypothetical protein
MMTRRSKIAGWGRRAETAGTATARGQGAEAAPEPEQQDEAAAPSRKRFAWIRSPAVWIGALVTAVITAAAVTLVTFYEDKALNAPPHLTGGPVKVISAVVEGGALSWVFPRPMTLSIAQLRKVEGHNDDFGVDDVAFGTWALNNGGAPLGGAFMVTVAGNRNHPVSIHDMRVTDAHCHAPYTGTIFYSPTAGFDNTLALSYDLDKLNPAPLISYGPNAGQDFFGGTNSTPKTISLAYGEQQVFRIMPSTARSTCTFWLQLTIQDGSSLVTEKIGYGNQPFATSASEIATGRGPNSDTIDFSRYTKVYAGGVASPACGDGGFLPIPPGPLPSVLCGDSPRSAPRINPDVPYTPIVGRWESITGDSRGSQTRIDANGTAYTLDDHGKVECEYMLYPLTSDRWEKVPIKCTGDGPAGNVSPDTLTLQGNGMLDWSLSDTSGTIVGHLQLRKIG